MLFLLSSQRVFYFFRSKFVCVFPTKEIAAAMFLDQFCSAVPCELTESIVAVDNRKIRHLSIPQNKISIRYTNYSIIKAFRIKKLQHGESINFYSTKLKSKDLREPSNFFMIV